MDIVIEVKNVSQNFKPDLITLKILMNKVDYFYTEAFKPIFVEPHIRFLFTPATEFEFINQTDYILPAERVKLNIYYKWTIGDIRSLIVKDFKDQAVQIAYFAKTFLELSNHNDLFLPAQINIMASNQLYFVSEEVEID